MTFLPIVERELRVAARRRGTYWVRLAVAMGAVFIGVPVYFVTQVVLGLSPQMTGQYVFQGFSGMMLVYCLLYGRQATADCLSVEKREGTLGLLFLTDLRGVDVVGGKLAATSLGGFYGLVAVFPVLAVTLLLGGISNGEFWRMVLLLVVTFLFTLAIGMFTSALSRDHHRAMAANFLLLLFLVGFLPACGTGLAYVFGSTGLIDSFYFTCPFFAFRWCLDVQYKAASGPFWMTLATMHLLTWVLLLLASVTVRNSWQDRPAGSGSRHRGWEGFWRACSYGSQARQERFRARALGINAFYWLAGRASLKPVHVWIFVGLMGVWWIGGWAASGRIWLDESEYMVTALLLNTTLKLWAVVEAGQRLALEKQSGTMELLLSTPLSVREILRGQWRALRRQFLAPFIVVLLVELLFLWRTSYRAHTRGMPLVWLAVMVMLVADFVALGWVAMAQALAARSYRRATMGTVVRILILPWVILALVVAARSAWSALMPGPAWEPETKFCVELWFGLGLSADLVFGVLAWCQLHKRFRSLAGQTFASAPAGLSGAGHPKPAGAAPVDGLESAPSQESIRPRRRFRRLAIAAGIVGILFAGGRFLFPKSKPVFPPPIAVSLSRSNAALQVFPGGQVALFVLPDGTLWQWGKTRNGINAAPVQLGTDASWAQAASGGVRMAALRRDGTLWEWGYVDAPNGGMIWIDKPRQVGASQDWIAVAAGMTHSAALRRDGTLWTWGNNSLGQLGIGPGQRPEQPTQVGTNTDWTSVSCESAGTLASRKNGTMWAWGRLDLFATAGNGPSVMPAALYFPSQICRETNWAEVSTGMGGLMRTRSGELWHAFYAAPAAEASAAAVCCLLVSNVAASRVAIGLAPAPKLYQLRNDGSLWERTQPLASSQSTAPGEWHRVGKRNDWVLISGANGTVYGVTADGFVWTWGMDPSRPAAPTLDSRIAVLRSRIGASVRLAPTTLPAGLGTAYSFTPEPRPLMRMLPP